MLTLNTFGHSRIVGNDRRGPAQEVQLSFVRRIRGRHRPILRALAGHGRKAPRSAAGHRLRTGCGSTITTATWSKSKSRQNRRRTKSPASRSSRRPAGERGAPYRSTTAPQPRPAALLMCCCSRATCARRSSFTRSVIGMRLSDQSGDNIAFYARHPRQRSSHDRLSHARTRPDIIISAGMSARSMRSAPAPCTCSTRALPKAGAWAGTCSARISSTTSRTRGAASANIPPISTTSRRLRLDGRRPPAGRFLLRLGPERARGFRP